MDWKTFIAEIVKATAWPLSIVAITVLMRSNVRKLLSAMRKFKHGETEITFDESVSDAKAEAVSAGLDVSENRNGVDTSIDAKLLDLASNYPSLAVIDAWNKIENRLVGFLPENYAKMPNWVRRVSLEMPRRLLSDNKINNDQYSLIIKLRRMRNRAAHFSHSSVSSISPANAYEYIELFRLVEGILKGIDGYKINIADADRRISDERPGYISY